MKLKIYLGVPLYRPRVRYNFTIDFKLFFNQMRLEVLKIPN